MTFNVKQATRDVRQPYRKWIARAVLLLVVLIGLIPSILWECGKVVGDHIAEVASAWKEAADWH